MTITNVNKPYGVDPKNTDKIEEICILSGLSSRETQIILRQQGYVFDKPWISNRGTTKNNNRFFIAYTGSNIWKEQLRGVTFTRLDIMGPVNHEAYVMTKSRMR